MLGQLSLTATTDEIELYKYQKNLVLQENKMGKGRVAILTILTINLVLTINQNASV